MTAINARFKQFQNRYLFVLLLSPLVLLGMLGIWNYENHIEQETLSIVDENHQVNSEEIHTAISSYLEEHNKSVRFVVNTPPISGIVRATENQGTDPLDNTKLPEWNNRLSKIFTAFLENSTDFYQLRLLDKNGVELLKVINDASKISRVQQAFLQDKSESFYFQEGHKLNPGQIYISNLNLNREFGTIEYPYKPTLRYIVPIYNNQNSLFGYFVANINATNLIEALKSLVSHPLKIIISDQDGFTINHFESDFNYSRDLRPELTVNQLITQIPAQISGFKSQLKQVKDIHNQLYIASKLYEPISTLGEGKGLTIHLLTPNSWLEQQYASKRTNFYGYFTLLSLVTLTIIAFLHRSFRRNQLLAEARAESQTIVETSNDGIIVFDKQGQIKKWNHSAASIFMWHNQDVQRSPITQYLSSIDELPGRINEAIKTRQLQIFKCDWINPYTNENHHLLLKINLISVDDPNSNLACTITDQTDITNAMALIKQNNEQLEKEVEKRTLELKAAHHKALEASQVKSSFIANISHEIRTPLNGINGALTLLKNNISDNKLNKFVDMADVSLESLHSLINDILDMSKIEAGKLEIEENMFSLRSKLERQAESLAIKAFDKNLEFFVDTSGIQVEQIKADAHRLTQVINNLINNAIKFTQAGYIMLTAKTITPNQNKLELHIEIKDTGIGINEARQKQLFAPFTQASAGISAQYGGTGLGLSICKKLVEMMGGEITLLSKPGQGTTMMFYITCNDWADKPSNQSEQFSEKNCISLTENPVHQTIIEKFIVAQGGTCTALNQLAGSQLDESSQTIDYILIDFESCDPDVIEQFKRTNADYIESNQTQFVYLIKPANEHKIPHSDTTQYIYKPMLYSDFETGLFSKPSVELFNAPEQQTGNEQLQQHKQDSTQPELSDALKHATILVVDDNEVNREVTKAFLNEVSANVELAVNGRECLNKLESLAQAKQTVDCILMDCNMPELNGFQTTDAIRHKSNKAINPDIPIIAMTANAMRGEKEKCLRAGMNDYISKPVDANELYQKLEKQLKTRTAANIPVLNTAENAVKLKYKLPSWDKKSALIRLMNNQTLLTRLCKMFLQSAPDKMQVLKSALNHQNYESVRQAAHALKGQSGDIGLAKLHHDLSSLETAAGASMEADCVQGFADVTAEFAKVMNMLGEDTEKA